MAGVIDLVVERSEVNPERLAEELAALGIAAYRGVSTGGGRVRVHVAPGLSEADRAAIRSAVLRHNRAAQSAQQKAAAARGAARAGLRKAWPAWTDADKDVFLRLLAAEWELIPEE
jgi:hypothetical protein